MQCGDAFNQPKLNKGISAITKKKNKKLGKKKTMNVTKYRKILLRDFQKVTIPLNFAYPFNSVNLVRKGEAYYISDGELCTGYKLRRNTEIFRPIFCYKRQERIDKLLQELHVTPFWNKQKRKYNFELSKVKRVPIECIQKIVSFIY